MSQKKTTDGANLKFDGFQSPELVAKTKEEFLVKSYNKTKAKTFFHKLGNSLGLVVVTLPLAGLLAAIGGIVITYAQNTGVMTFGLILSGMGQAVLANLGLLFMLAIIMGFTGNKGMAVYAAVIAYIAFIAFSVPFIRWNMKEVNGKMIPDTFNIWFWKELIPSTQLFNIFGVGRGAMPLEAIKANSDGNIVDFYHNSWQGIESLNTGVLGGIVLGFIYTWTYNRFKDLKLPQVLAFFEGEKFVALLNIMLAPIVASLFIIIWPAVNYALGGIGIGLSYIPFGIDSALYGMITRMLLPFEAHPAFYGPLWWTSAGGSLGGDTQMKMAEAALHRIITGNTPGIGQELTYYNNVITPWLESVKLSDGTTTLKAAMESIFKDKTPANIDYAAVGNLSILNSDGTIMTDLSSKVGDLFTKTFAGIKWDQEGDQKITLELLLNNPGFDMRDAWAINLKVTRFISGGFANLMFMIPAVGFAMWATLDTQARKEKFGFYMGAIITSFVLGITEPIEFLFAYSAPLIFFCFYAPFYGVVFGLANLFQVKLGSTFSQGLVDYIVNAIIPTAVRSDSQGVSQTLIWVPIVLGVISAAIAFPLFRWIFIKFEFAAPGSKAFELGTGVSKSKYTRIKEDYDGLVAYFGGLDNIESIQMTDSNQAIITVKAPSSVVNNAFTADQLNQLVQKDNVYTINLTNQDEGMEYLGMAKGMVDLRNRTEEQKITAKNNKKAIKNTIKDVETTKGINDAQKTKAQIKHEQKVFKAECKHLEAINKINAHWEFKEDQLLNTKDIEKLKFNYKVDGWKKSHKQERALDKAELNYKLALATDDATKQKAKDEYANKISKLVVDQTTKTNDKIAYKEQLKKLKAIKKETFKKERAAAKAEDKVKKEASKKNK